MTFFPSTRAARRRSRSTAGAALGLLGVLLLTGCESAPAEQAGAPATDPNTGGGGVQQQVPEPSGNQLSHEEMREQLESRYPDAVLSDTTDYWAGLRDIETELQRLVVDPPECKQFVVRSAVPVPAGALVAFADDTADAAQDEGAEESEDAGDGAEESEGEPEAGASEAAPRIQLASTEEEDSGGSAGEDSSNEDSGNEGSEGDDSGDSDSEGGDSEEEPEPEPVTVDLPAERQAVIYSFRDWRAADAHLAAEQDGLESCDSYTASRGGEDSVETSTSVDPVEVSTDLDAALGTTRRISSEGEREHSVAVTLREGSHIVTISVPLPDALSEEESEVAAEELEVEAADLLGSLD